MICFGFAVGHDISGHGQVAGIRYDKHCWTAFLVYTRAYGWHSEQINGHAFGFLLTRLTNISPSSLLSSLLSSNSLLYLV
jgi:hypothetical protein